MYSNRSEYSHRRSDDQSSSRHKWPPYKDSWEEKHESHGRFSRDFQYNHGADGHYTDRASRPREYSRREYSRSPHRVYGKDSLSRRSPVRTRASSPVWEESVKKWSWYSEDADSNYRRRRLTSSERHSPDMFSNSHKTKDLSCVQTKEDGFKYRKTSTDYRSRYEREEFAQRKHHHQDKNYSSGPCEDGGYQRRRQDFQHEMTKTPDIFIKNDAKKRRTDRSLNENKDIDPSVGSTGKSFQSDATAQSAAVPAQTVSKGFQRFLDVLNKGVNIEDLTKIVSQNPKKINDGRISPGSILKAPDHPESPHSHYRKTDGRFEIEKSHRQASPGYHQTPKRPSASDQNPPQEADSREHSSKSKSPSVEKMTLTPEDEQKCRQMQDVLQAIGMDFGFEELGQMSHRIQERLYGKKDGDRGHKPSREKSQREKTSPSTRSSSSSSRSSLQDMAKDCSAPNYPTKVHQIPVRQSFKHSERTNYNYFEEIEECRAEPEKSSPPLNPSFPAYPVDHSAAPLRPPYFPISTLQSQGQAPLPPPPLQLLQVPQQTRMPLPPASQHPLLQAQLQAPLPPLLRTSFPVTRPPSLQMPMQAPLQSQLQPPLHPSLPQALQNQAFHPVPPPFLPVPRPGIVFPLWHSQLPQQLIRPPNVFPQALAQTGSLIPPPPFPPPNVIPEPSNEANAKKSKVQVRSRCLQIIK